MADQISVSVVICTRNRCESLQQCLASVVGQDYLHYEIIVINDSSNDGTREVLDHYHANTVPIKVFHNNRNMGICYSRNKGVALAANEIIAFIDDDCIAKKDWLTELTKPFNNPRVAVVGGLIKDPQPINLSMVAARGHYKRFNKEGPCDSLPGGAANLAVRKQFYITHPPQNPELEDWEICQIAVDSGHIVYNCPKAVVVHEHYHNLRTLLRQRYRYGVGQTWFRKRFKRYPLNLKTISLLATVLSLPFIALWKILLIPALGILCLLFSNLLIKDVRKGEKTAWQAIISFPIFMLIALSECYGRLVGLFKKPKQINFGVDFVKITDKKNEIFYDGSLP